MEVLFSVVQQKWQPARLLYYLNHLPEAIRNKVTRLQQWQDLQLSLCGYLLLQKALQTFTGYRLSLGDIQRDAWNKPFFKDPFQFNISHSGEYVVCAIGGDKK